METQLKQDKMNVIIAINASYVLVAKRLINSLAKLHKKNTVVVHVLFSNLSKEEKEIIQESSNGDIIVNCIPIDDSIVNIFPAIERFPQEVCLRLVAPFFLDLDKALYLDSDILLTKDIADLYHINIDDYYAAVCKDKNSNNDAEFAYLKNLPFDEGDDYFNSGVMLLNFRKIRQDFNLNDFPKFIKDNERFLKYPDQDILNCMFAKKIFWLDEQLFNNQTHNSELPDFDNASIIHYVGPSKPWDYKYRIGFSEMKTSRISYTYFWHCLLEQKIAGHYEYAQFLTKRFFYRFKYFYTLIAALLMKNG